MLKETQSQPHSCSQTSKLRRLELIAAKMRCLIIEGVFRAESGHPGGSLSCADLLAYLYFEKLRVFPDNPTEPSRDRFVLSKGHACPALYSALALRGFFPEEEMLSLRKLGHFLQGHPDMQKIPGIDMSTGSLGQGFSAACGMALRAKRESLPYRVYTLLGDGECQEGQVWEAAMFASHYGLDNLTAFLDLNYLQIDGDVREVMNPEPLDKKFAAFGWDVQTIDGHDFFAIEEAIERSEKSGAPSMIICRTVKGKGVSYMENNADWHGKAPKKDDYETACAQLYADLEKKKALVEGDIV